MHKKFLFVVLSFISCVAMPTDGCSEAAREAREDEERAQKSKVLEAQRAEQEDRNRAIAQSKVILLGAVDPVSKKPLFGANGISRGSTMPGDDSARGETPLAFEADEELNDQEMKREFATQAAVGFVMSPFCAQQYRSALQQQERWADVEEAKRQPCKRHRAENNNF